MMEDKLLEALSILALKELCSYIDLDGNPVICDWEAYVAMTEMELNKYKLTHEQFDEIKAYLEKTYKGKL